MENEQLLQYINKIDGLNNQIDELRAEIRGVFADAKANGFSVRAIKEILKLKKMNDIDREEFEFERKKYMEMLKNA